MTNASRGLRILVLTLAAAAPLRAAQVGDTQPAHPPSTASADSGSGRGAHHPHHHDGGKHGAGKKSLSFDTSTNTVTFKLVAGRPHGPSRLNFNGHTDGNATLVIPPKSHVVMPFVNKDSVPHSAALIADSDPMPALPAPVIPHAATRELTRGLPLHQRHSALHLPGHRLVPDRQRRTGAGQRRHVDSPAGGSPSARSPRWEKDATEASRPPSGQK